MQGISNFPKLLSGSYDSPGLLSTIPAATTPGKYVLSWNWNTYYSCAVIQVNVPAFVSNINGPSSNNPSNMNGGQAFGIAFLVILLVSIAALVGLLVFLKLKRPATFDDYKMKATIIGATGVTKVKSLFGK